ncbi:uncharacterized protein Dwil_GK26820 [Drosophila willistoni]|uniref:Uncharacterized protein n=1 Tax=Drosophila willistoni TaxID=7260 RepID=A0A0Q9WUA0_DROWI|nr:uncharacterized protein LOC26528822 isoform X4 [Drosophila willistoni]KRF99444.1 uncharacterized protein Dwil_GK26820 [Drosophila willistoni]
MKLLAVLAALIAAASAQSIRKDSEGWYVPQLEGSVVWRPRDEFLKNCGGYDKFDFNPVHYYLYTNADPLD